MSEKKKENHPVFIVQRDWTKTNIHTNTIAEKTGRIPSLSVPSAKQTEIKCARQVYVLPH